MSQEFWRRIDIPYRSHISMNDVSSVHLSQTVCFTGTLWPSSHSCAWHGNATWHVGGCSIHMYLLSDKQMDLINNTNQILYCLTMTHYLWFVMMTYLTNMMKREIHVLIILLPSCYCQLFHWYITLFLVPLSILSAGHKFSYIFEVSFYLYKIVTLSLDASCHEFVFVWY